MAEGYIELSNVKKSFGPKHVLNGVTLSVPKGHSLVVIGGSGTGTLNLSGGSITATGAVHQTCGSPMPRARASDPVWSRWP